MPRPVIFEYDPTTGQTLATSSAEELFPVVSLADIAEEAPSHSWSAATSEVYGPMEPTASVPRRVAPAVPPPPQIQAAALKMPLGAQVLGPSGLQKVRNYIQQATDMDKLAEMDKALQAGDMYRLKAILNLRPEDFRKQEVEKKVSEEVLPPKPAEKVPEEKKPEPKPKKLKAKKSKKVKAGEGQVEALEPYEDSAEVPAKKPRTSEPQTLEWPMAWTWLLSRTQQHPEFRQPTAGEGVLWAEEKEDKEGGLAVAIATSLVYVGDTSSGYDPKHLARVVAVDEKGEVLLDLHVQPRSKLLDCRPHLTGLKKEALEAARGAVGFEAARGRLLDLLKPRTILVGHRLANDLEALRLYHGPLVDTALLFAVDSRKKSQYHPLRYLGEQVLLIASRPEELELPHDALEAARLAMRLAVHESLQEVATKALPPREGSGRELVVRHIPSSWGQQAGVRLSQALPGIGQVAVRWILNDLDPTDWRGEAVVFLPDAVARDHVFRGVKGLTDVHVQWEDAPGAPPLGSFLTEQALIEAFSRFGMVVCARIPRKPTTQEPQSFAFVSYFDCEDAHRASKQSSVEVALTETWQMELRPRLAKYGNSNDKRVAVKASDDDVGFDWIHLIKM